MEQPVRHRRARLHLLHQSVPRCTPARRGQAPRPNSPALQRHPRARRLRPRLHQVLPPRPHLRPTGRPLSRRPPGRARSCRSRSRSRQVRRLLRRRPSQHCGRLPRTRVSPPQAHSHSQSRSNQLRPIRPTPPTPTTQPRHREASRVTMTTRHSRGFVLVRVSTPRRRSGAMTTRMTNRSQ